MIDTAIADGVATLTLNRTHRLNALTWEAMRQLHEAIEQAAATHGVCALVLTGAGRAFCVGADLRDFDDAVDDPGPAVEGAMMSTLTPLCQALLSVRVPVVAAVNGPCVGGGLGLALLADITIAARSAYFLVPQVTSLGIVPDAGATWILARHVGRARALGMSLTGARISAEQSEDGGLIWRCVDDTDLMATAREAAIRIGATPAAALATRALVDAATAVPAGEQLDAEAHAQRLLFADPVVIANIVGFAQRGDR